MAAAYTDNVDTNYDSSNGSLNETVTRGQTTTTLTSSSNPSVSGQPLNFVATVGIDSPAVGTLTGYVTFTGVTCDSGNSVLISGDMASCSVSAGLDASGSPYEVSASYGDDPNFSGSSSGKLKQNVDKAATTIVLSATPDDCSGNVCSVSAGAAVSFTATVTSNSPGSGTPDGSVVFSVVRAGRQGQGRRQLRRWQHRAAERRPRFGHGDVQFLGGPAGQRVLHHHRDLVRPELRGHVRDAVRNEWSAVDGHKRVPSEWHHRRRDVQCDRDGDRRRPTEFLAADR